MTDLGRLFVCTFGNYLTPILITSQTANNVDFGNKRENEDYESKGS